ncbi:hypothetical protein RF007C_16060 [Ruminococcus flavefaciens 007c]|uniref:Uncharacterized protein n=1 Tax=Ruminococcus flavefaciens 007c TaxID=1341157 RepID=W7UWV2_RUMFL|nr:hypothetical protein RF007C_16060 [Ruminococcus flavefaciens 007c]
MKLSKPVILLFSAIFLMCGGWNSINYDLWR